jgi:hypothetical protein|tara:strand:+ start:2713 stop:3057 length:345 start_codon:yes stop_codon:yes gene_type:complete
MGKLTENTYSLTGKSGKKYTFGIYSMDTTFSSVGGIYVFTKRTKSGESFSHSNKYIGKTNDLSTRFDNHHKEDCIIENNANCLCVMRVDSEDDRTEYETDLLLGNNTTCNEVNN